MSKKKILGIVTFVVLIVSSLLLLTGCPQHVDSSYGVKVTGDGSGGAIAIYENKLGGSVYAQKISPDGERMWGEKGVLIDSSDSKAYSYSMLNIISDSSGGAIVAWTDLSEGQFRPASHLARIDSEGKLVWRRDFIYFKYLVSDGSGGAIITFDYSVGVDIVGDETQDLTLVKVDAQGDYPWGLQGIHMPLGKYQDSTLQMTPDGSGGVMVVWEEVQRPPEAKPGESVSTGRIFTQKVNSEGETEWGDDVLVYTTPENTYAEAPQIISDGSGGAIAIWQQMYSGRIEGGSPEAEMMDIFVQKLDAGGNILWQANGMPLEINKNAGNAFPTQPMMVSDGSGGAIIIWRDTRDRASVYAQKVDAGGTISWQVGGIKVASTSLNPHPRMVSGSLGEVLISYSFQEDGKMLHVQKLDSSGETLWLENDVQVIDGDYQGYSISPDGQEGVIVGWGVGKGTFSAEKAYIQRVSADGKLLWGEKGVRLNP